jgi:hypothetical protein
MTGRHRNHRRPFWRIALTLSIFGAVPACGDTAPDPEPVGEHVAALSQDASAFAATFARQWMTNLVNSVKFDQISPPVAARTYAYGAIAMYEATVHGMPGHQSLAGQLNGLGPLPVPDPNLEYDWPTVLARTMKIVSLNTYVFPERLFFEFITPAQATLTALGDAQIAYRQAAGVPQSVIDDSIAYADQLAFALVQWANSDGYAEARYKGWIPPTGPDKWVPTGFSDDAKVANPAEPGFGGIRPLVLEPGECPAPAPIPFDDQPGSLFYNQAQQVHDIKNNLTEEQLVIARFWEDGPGATGTPPAHWIAITTAKVGSMTLADAVAAYAYVSIGFLDSFIASWQSKYEYNLLRPETYIRRHIASDWTPLLMNPQFPTYSSGHSTQSFASAVILTDMFGGGPFTDATKLRRGFGARTFANYTAAAEEAGISRVYRGIHFQMDNTAGQVQGNCVGNLVVSRVQLTP